MIARRAYYAIKPYLGKRVRLAFRRWLARRTLRGATHVWPILEGAAKQPDGWRGWPDGKQFAFVLTHDVEGKSGISRVKALAELELALGFRSSFNLIPEGEYHSPNELRDWLTQRGFEIGVHDLHHDGSLFRSHRDFHRQAPRINHHLNEWGAVGFRAGFMFHELNWIGALDIEYDASTFDTDPFEPQPDGVNTIFPFWVPRTSEVGGQRSEIRGQRSGARSLNSSRDRVAAERDSQRQLSTLNEPRSGYVELPYTLAQDSTLFLLLQSQTADIWTRKLDWVAQHGGMALVNVHPDYLTLDGSPSSLGQFPIARYRDLLTHVRTRYADTVWNVVPRDLARWFKSQTALTPILPPTLSGT